MPTSRLTKEGNAGHKTITANEVYTHASGTDTIEAGLALSQYKPDEY